MLQFQADIKFGKILPIGSQDIERKQNFVVKKGHNSGTNFQKLTRNNPKLDIVNMNACIKFGEICHVVFKILGGNEISA